MVIVLAFRRRHAANETSKVQSVFFILWIAVEDLPSAGEIARGFRVSLWPNYGVREGKRVRPPGLSRLR